MINYFTFCDYIPRNVSALHFNNCIVDCSTALLLDCLSIFSNSVNHFVISYSVIVTLNFSNSHLIFLKAYIINNQLLVLF